MMPEEYAKLMFASVIGYGMLFCGLLCGAGVALGEPWTIQMAVVAAGAAYVTQIAASLSMLAAYAGWAVALVAGVSGVWAMFGG